MFPYAPKVYRDYLTSHDLLPDDVRVSGDVPTTRPDRLVTIRSAPAGPTAKPRFLAWRRLIFQCWDADETSAGELAELVRELVVQSVYARIGVHRVNVIGEPGRFDDPDNSTSSRFQMTADVLFRANR
jgi:hypothetical protein